MQCIETCRSRNKDYAVFNEVLKTCHCIHVLESDLEIIDNPYGCEDKHYKVFSTSVFPAPQSCDSLYFRKQVFFWDDYKLGNIAGTCPYSKPAELYYDSWDQKAEKLARTSLMFSDKVSVETPDQGVTVDYESSGAENIWSSSLHRVHLPWTMESGFRTGENRESLVFDFGQNKERSAVIWGMQFLTAQLAAKGAVTMKVSYRHEHDISAGGYTAGDWRSPHGTESGDLTFSFSAASLDSNGLYYFKQPPPNQQNNLIFVATEVKIILNSGYLNFDFLGTFYDHNTAVTGTKDGSDDDWNTRYIGDFWISEDSSESTITTPDENEAVSQCLALCSGSEVNSFYALRIKEFGKYKCKCLDLSFTSIVAEVSQLLDVKLLHVFFCQFQSNDYLWPLNEVKCPEATDQYITAFDGDSTLMDFLTTSTLSLWTNDGQMNDTQQRVNICNPDRIIDMVTLYLAHALGLNTNSIKENFVFEKTKTYVFPDSLYTGPAETFPPNISLTDFPNLEQTYWTIISQYTASSEPSLRAGKSAEWCWLLGKGLHDHCLLTSSSLNCSQDTCQTVWANFVEACHRVRSIDTSEAGYELCSWCSPDYPCLYQTYSQADLYQLYRLSVCGQSVSSLIHRVQVDPGL